MWTALLAGGETISPKGISRGSKKAAEKWLPNQTFLSDPCLEDGRVKEECSEEEKFGLALPTDK